VPEEGDKSFGAALPVDVVPFGRLGLRRRRRAAEESHDRQKILVPVDFSEHSKRALACAKTLEERFEASLHLLTVVPDPFALPNPGRWYVPVAPEYVDGLPRADSTTRR